jgi:hypothetical protein
VKAFDRDDSPLRVVSPRRVPDEDGERQIWAVRNGKLRREKAPANAK